MIEQTYMCVCVTDGETERGYSVALSVHQPHGQSDGLSPGQPNSLSLSHTHTTHTHTHTLHTHTIHTHTHYTHTQYARTQEDTDTMVQELERWRAENNSHRESLHREERLPTHNYTLYWTDASFTVHTYIHTYTVYTHYIHIHTLCTLHSLYCMYSITENELAPLKSQLEEVELHISEQVCVRMHVWMQYTILSFPERQDQCSEGNHHKTRRSHKETHEVHHTTQLTHTHTHTSAHRLRSTFH